MLGSISRHVIRVRCLANVTAVLLSAFSPKIGQSDDLNFGVSIGECRSVVMCMGTISRVAIIYIQLHCFFLSTKQWDDAACLIEFVK